MANDDQLSMLTSEFNLWGVKFTTRKLGSGHIEVEWRATPDKELRHYTISLTPGDWRGGLNARAHVRRTFKQDGLSLKKPERPKPPLHKALELPQPVEKDADQIRMLRAEVADLTELVLDLSGALTVVKDFITTSKASEADDAGDRLISHAKIASLFLSKAKPPSVRSIKTISYVSEGWNSTDALAEAMEIEPTIAYRKLYYLMKKGAVELSGGRWRRKPKLKLVEA